MWKRPIMSNDDLQLIAAQYIAASLAVQASNTLVKADAELAIRIQSESCSLLAKNGYDSRKLTYADSGGSAVRPGFAGGRASIQSVDGRPAIEIDDSEYFKMLRDTFKKLPALSLILNLAL